MIYLTTFGIGGYDPSKPNNNIVEIVEIPDAAESEAADSAQPPQA